MPVLETVLIKVRRGLIPIDDKCYLKADDTHIRIFPVGCADRDEPDFVYGVSMWVIPDYSLEVTIIIEPQTRRESHQRWALKETLLTRGVVHCTRRNAGTDLDGAEMDFVSRDPELVTGRAPIVLAVKLDAGPITGA